MIRSKKRFHKKIHIINKNANKITFSSPIRRDTALVSLQFDEKYSGMFANEKQKLLIGRYDYTFKNDFNVGDFAYIDIDIPLEHDISGNSANYEIVYIDEVYNTLSVVFKLRLGKFV